jgi:hypothetical protein
LTPHENSPPTGKNTQRSTTKIIAEAQEIPTEEEDKLNKRLKSMSFSHCLTPEGVANL